jgi:hypothetical protein
MSFDQDVAVLNDIVSLRNRVSDKRTKALLTSALKRHGRTLKRYIDNICENGMEPHAVLLDEIVWAQNGEKIRAIKSYRERTGLGLYESKCAIDKAMA